MQSCGGTFSKSSGRLLAEPFASETQRRLRAGERRPDPGGHKCDSEDLNYLRGLMERGSTIGTDRFGFANFRPTGKRAEVLARLCAEGYTAKMVRPHSAKCWSDMLSEKGNRRTRLRYTHISDDILPVLRKAGRQEEHIEQLCVRNPRAILEAS